MSQIKYLFLEYSLDWYKCNEFILLNYLKEKKSKTTVWDCQYQERMDKNLSKKLFSRIENRYSIRIIFACEWGSRAYGMHLKIS